MKNIMACFLLLLTACSSGVPNKDNPDEVIGVQLPSGELINLTREESLLVKENASRLYELIKQDGFIVEENELEFTEYYLQEVAEYKQMIMLNTSSQINLKIKIRDFIEDFYGETVYDGYLAGIEQGRFGSLEQETLLVFSNYMDVRYNPRVPNIVNSFCSELENLRAQQPCDDEYKKHLANMMQIIAGRFSYFISKQTQTPLAKIHQKYSADGEIFSFLTREYITRL